jgi:hypothetical protein
MNEKDTRIILYLASEPNSIGKAIADKTDLSESEVSKHLNNLKKDNILDNQTCPTQEGKNYAGKCWYVIEDFPILKKLVNKFDDPDKLQEFAQSRYYHNQIPQLIDEFEQRIPTLKGEPIIFFSTDDKFGLEEALKGNWLALKFVLRFTDDVGDHERIELIKKIQDILKHIVKCTDVWAEDDELNMDVPVGAICGEYLDVQVNDVGGLDGDASFYEPIHWKTLFTLLADASDIVSLLTRSEG